MNPIVPIAYRFLVSHFAPGVLSLYILAYVSSPIHSIVCKLINTDFNLGLVLALAIIALVAGLIIDGISFVCVERLVRKIRIMYYHQQDADRKIKSKDDFEFVESVTSIYHAWKQFYRSSSLILFTACILHLFKVLPSIELWKLLLTFFIALVLLVAAAKSAARNEEYIAKYFEGK